MTYINDLSNQPNESDRNADYIQLAKSIADDYDKGITHGVQKDAIQNGWDAIAGSLSPKNISKNWSFTFELIEQKDGILFTMTDAGTTGLTGIYTAEDKIPASKLSQEERWARFESLAFNKNDSGGLGARGQGKMIFIHASQDKCIAYDSIRDDNTYRAGYTIAKEIGCPVWHYDEKEARDFIINKLKLQPLSRTGTRIIILNPVQTLVKAVRDGDFKDYIEETWWPLIYKYGAKIYIKNKEEIIVAKVPDIFPIQDEKSKSKVSKDLKFKYNGRQYNIKRIALAYDKDSSFNNLHSGVACFRNGMKIETLEPYLSDEKLYGYAEFDEKVDELLYEVEKPSHYGFIPNTGIWSPLRRTLKDQIIKFEQDVLGIKLEKKNTEYIKSTHADKIAFSILKDLTKGWGLLNTGSSGISRPPNPNPPPTPEPVLIGIMINNLRFPNDENIPRVDYGNVLTGFKCITYNKKGEGVINVNLILDVLSESGEKCILSLLNENFTLNPTDTKIFDDLEITINENIFREPGKYKLRAKLSNTDTKELLHKITRDFWVETDPPLRNPFELEKVDFTALPDDSIHRLSWILQSEGDNRYTCWINIGYPQYKQNADTEGSLGLYQGQLFFEAAIQIMLRRIDDDPSLEGAIGPFNIDKIRNSDLSELYVDIMKQISNAKFDIFSKY